MNRRRTTRRGAIERSTVRILGFAGRYGDRGNVMVAVSELLHRPDLVLAGLAFLLIVVSAIVGIVPRIGWNAARHATAPLSGDEEIR